MAIARRIACSASSKWLFGNGKRPRCDASRRGSDENNPDQFVALAPIERAESGVVRHGTVPKPGLLDRAPSLMVPYQPLPRLQLNSSGSWDTTTILRSGCGQKGQKGKSKSKPSNRLGDTWSNLIFLHRNMPSSAGELLFAQACASISREIEGALELYQQAVQADPNLSGAWRNLGALLRQRGQFAEARHCTEQALKLDATDGSLWGNYGNVLRDQGHLEESRKAFHEGLKRAPGSRSLLQGLAISLGRRG